MHCSESVADKRTNNHESDSWLERYFWIRRLYCSHFRVNSSFHQTSPTEHNRIKSTRCRAINVRLIITLAKPNCRMNVFWSASFPEGLEWLRIRKNGHWNRGAQTSHRNPRSKTRRGYWSVLSKRRWGRGTKYSLERTIAPWARARGLFWPIDGCSGCWYHLSM